MWVVFVILFEFSAVTGISLSDAEHNSLPRLFHMDDYGRCLSRPGALYCMGSFRLTPATSPHHMFDVLKEYSIQKNSFDRTLLHRGYCVSRRCAGAAGNVTSLADKTEWFESCVQKWARPLRLTPRLETLDYCRSPEDRLLETRAAAREDSTHQLLLTIVYTLMFMNVVGTVYDVSTADDVKKNRILLAWSIRSNWRRLVASYDDGDERLSALNPLQGVRVLLLTIVLVAHAGFIHHMVYLSNPQVLEWMMAHPLMMIVKNGATIVQIFVMFSSFLLAYNMLIYSNSKQKLSLALLPKVIGLRIARIAPVYFFVLLLATSWWPLLRDGPMWQLLVSKESEVCKRKFWSHLLFINNYVESDSHCLMQTWFLAVDMQLHIVAAVILLTIAQFKLKPLPILSAMFVGACVLNAILAYVFDWKSLMYITSPDNFRTQFKGVPSFSGIYTSAWGSLPACILGLYVAHKHYYEEVDGNKIQHSLIFRSIIPFTIPLIFAWLLAGNFINDVNHPLLTSLFTAIERPGFSLIVALMVYSYCKKIDSWTRRLFGWHGFRVLARMSLSVLMLHWCMDMVVAGARPSFLHTSLLDMFSDGIATWVFTYVLAIPFTIFLEMPAYRFITAIL